MVKQATMIKHNKAILREKGESFRLARRVREVKAAPEEGGI